MAYQSETASLHSTSQNLLRVVHTLFTERSLSVLTRSCHVCLNSNRMLWLYRLDGLESLLNPSNG